MSVRIIDDELTEIYAELGKWLAIIDGKVVAEGNSAKEIFDKTKAEYGDKEPFLVRVPDNPNMLLLLLYKDKE